MFEKLVSFTKDVSDLDNRPALDPAVIKAQFDAAPDEVRQYLNKLIDALLKNTAGDSGAKNIGATNITGLTGMDVQTLLESLKTEVDKRAAKIQSGWIDLPLQAPAVPYDGSGGYPAKPQYRITEWGEVVCRGAIKGIATGVCANLPTGARPLAATGLPLVRYSDLSNETQFARCTIKADGTITLDVGHTAFVSLDNIRFYIN
jgi:hypothetical protein